MGENTDLGEHRFGRAQVRLPKLPDKHNSLQDTRVSCMTCTSMAEIPPIEPKAELYHRDEQMSKFTL